MKPLENEGFAYYTRWGKEVSIAKTEKGRMEREGTGEGHDLSGKQPIK